METGTGEHSIGQRPLKLLLLPSGWQSAAPAPEEPQLTKFCRVDDPSIEVWLFNPGIMLNGLTARNLVDVLDEPPHELSPKEFSDVSIAFLEETKKRRDFQRSSACTIQLNGRIVCIERGHWKQANRDSPGAIIDCNGDGLVLRHIYYVAPPMRFEEHLDEFQMVLEQIVWNPERVEGWGLDS